MPDNYGVYQLRNIQNDNIYIGSSTRMRKRWNEHKSDLRHGKHDNTRMQSDFDAYGECSFEFSVLECTDNLIGREQYYIDTLNPQYNMQRIAGSSLGKPCSEETKQKLSQAMKKANHPLYGVGHSEETKRKMSQSHKGKPGNSAKLNVDEVRTIKSLLKRGYTDRKLSDMFGVNVATINDIRHSRTWVNIKA